MTVKSGTFPLIVATALFLIASQSSAAPAGSTQKPARGKAESVEARLQRLEDREAIRKVIMDYGRFLDGRDFLAFSRLFANNGGEWVGGMGSAKGPAAIRKLMEDSIGIKSRGTNFHLFTNESIQVDADHATALTKWIFVVQGPDKRPQLVYLGHYDDTFVREEGAWKFQRRIVSGDIPADDPLAAK